MALYRFFFAPVLLLVAALLGPERHPAPAASPAPAPAAASARIGPAPAAPPSGAHAAVAPHGGGGLR
jgi:hypothetical protein